MRRFFFPFFFGSWFQVFLVVNLEKVYYGKANIEKELV